MQEQGNGPEANSRVQGDEKHLPNRGSRTGVEDSYGADLSPDATNKVRGLSRDTQSDAEEA